MYAVCFRNPLNYIVVMSPLASRYMAGYSSVQRTIGLAIPIPGPRQRIDYFWGHYGFLNSRLRGNDRGF